MPYRPDRLGVWLQTAAALGWLAQAACIAWAVQGMLDGRGMDRVIPAAAGLLLAGVLRSLADAWGGRRLHAAARAHVSALRERAVRALAGRSPLDTGRAPSGLAASVLAEQAESILPYLARYLPARRRLMVLPPVLAAAAACHSWAAALVMLLAAPLIPVFMALVGWRAKAASEAQLAEMGGMNAFLLDRLRGLATLRALGAVRQTAERLDASAQSLRQRTMKVLRIAFLSSAVLELFSALGVALVAVYIGFHLLGYLPFGAWGGTLSLGQGLFVLLLTPAFFEPLRDFAAAWHDRAAGMAALEALAGLAERGTAMPAAPVWSGQPRAGEQARAMPAVPPPAGAVSAVPAIRLRGVTLCPPGGDTPLFDQLSLDIAEGEHVALTGASGSGKSLLLAAVAGLLPLRHGTVEVCGLSPSDSAAQRRIGWLGQKPHVFAGTVLANVAMGRPGIGRAAVDAALEQARLGRVSQAHAGQPLGEGGQGLSGGEAARLALARVAADPSVRVIVADEPTAHLDRQTAQDVTRALLDLARGRALLVATHDPVLVAAMRRQVDVQALRAGPPAAAAPMSPQNRSGAAACADDAPVHASALAAGAAP